MSNVSIYSNTFHIVHFPLDDNKMAKKGATMRERKFGKVGQTIYRKKLMKKIKNLEESRNLGF